MATRREFLLSSFAAAAPGFASGIEAPRPPDAGVFAEIQCQDTLDFARSCNAGCCISASDPGEALFALEARLAAPGLERICGLSRPSSQFLVEQIALRRDFELIYRGVHRYTPSGLCHSLDGSRALTTSLFDALHREPRHWAGALARVFAHAHGGRAEYLHAGMTAPISAPAGSSLQLASWFLARR